MTTKPRVYGEELKTKVMRNKCIAFDRLALVCGYEADEEWNYVVEFLEDIVEAGVDKEFIATNWREFFIPFFQHEVKGHTRKLKNGKETSVKEHRRFRPSKEACAKR